ncbi:Uma2 family endonuclease [Actinocorallia sp. B10E7]|uniref:Uma2 family endonuclease n=1 Tax=Actinocorallia sp. B10E7 TaxID=3153558 RepID=UPI00325DD156
MASRDLPDAQQAFGELIVPEGFRAELIDGEIILSPSGRRLHWRLISRIAAQLTSLTDWECITEQTIQHPRFTDLPEPDLAVLPYTDEPSDDTYHPADEVVFVVEVVSRRDPHNDGVRKTDVYARFGIPLHLTVDPFKGRCVLRLVPQSGDERVGPTYTEHRVFPFGEPIDLPPPLNITLDTSTFRTYGPPST